MKFLILGDSQAAGPPGQAAENRLLESNVVRRVGNSGKGPYDYTRLQSLWSQYESVLRDFSPEYVLFIFGSNDRPGRDLTNALEQFRRSTDAPMWISGPPYYPDQVQDQRGRRIGRNYQEVFGDDHIDARRWTRRASRARDGLHFTRTGGRRWGHPLADEVLQRISALR